MQKIKWCPFSQKHIDYITRGLDNKMSVAEGSVRGGKTIDNCIIASAYLEVCEDKIHLASGSTIANAKLNIGDCNGFGLEYIFGGRCRWGKYKDNEALFIDTQTGQKIVVFAGGGKADSYKKILGNSYGLWIATEINEHYDSDDSRTSFIKVALARQVASRQPRILWDLNPSNPNHKIYKDYIDKYEANGLVGGYNYEHFTIEDNLSISEQRKEEIKSMYDPNSIWYRRDILGIRCVAEGLIYDSFANNPERFIYDEVPKDLVYVNVGVDFGGNGSKHTFVCTGFTRNFKDVIVLENEKIETNVSPTQLEDRYVAFVKMCYNKYGKPITSYPDSAEQVLIKGMVLASAKAGLPNQIFNARKNEIKQRIMLLLKLMGENRFHIMKNCQQVKGALETAMWDSKKVDARLDDGTSDIDTIDALEYSIEPFMSYLLDTSRLKGE